MCSCRDALDAELSTCKEGLTLALQRSDLAINIELDSVNAVNMIQSTEVDRSIYAHVVQEIKQLRSSRTSCITHVHRCQNKASDRLASFARINDRTMTWLGSGLDEILEIVRDDCKDILIE